MKKSRFTESQIVAILKEGEAGVAVAQLTRKHGISAATYYHWKSKYGGAAVSELKRLRELEAENAKLKPHVRRSGTGEHGDQGRSEPKCMVRPGFARSSLNDENSLRKCIRPLASQGRLPSGHDEMRAHGSYQTAAGCKPVFGCQAYRTPIDCFVILVWTSQTLIAGS